MSSGLGGLAANIAQDLHLLSSPGDQKAVHFLDPTADAPNMGDLISPLRPSLAFKDPELDEPKLLNPGARTDTFMPSQVWWLNQVSISYTATQLRLLWYDFQLILGKLPATVGIMLPWRLGKTAYPYDEMLPMFEIWLAFCPTPFLLLRSL
jgi:hypothetical protein